MQSHNMQTCGPNPTTLLWLDTLKTCVRLLSSHGLESSRDLYKPPPNFNPKNWESSSSGELRKGKGRRPTGGRMNGFKGGVFLRSISADDSETVWTQKIQRCFPWKIINHLSQISMLGRSPTSSNAAALIFRVSVLFFEAKSHLHFDLAFTQQR